MPDPANPVSPGSVDLSLGSQPTPVAEDAWPNYKGASVGSANPLDTIGSFATIQNQLNQNRLFQQQFAARKVAGEIIAGSPDMESAFVNLTKNPQVAPFAGDIINSYRAAQYTQAETAGLLQTQAQSGVQAVMKASVGALRDPSLFEPLVDAQLATLSPYARNATAKAVSSYRLALTGNLPTADSMEATLGRLPTPAELQAARIAKYQQNFTAIAAAGNLSQDNINSIMGFAPVTQQRGGYIQPGLLGLPGGSAAPGSFTPAGGAAAMTLAPQTVGTPGGVPVVVGGGVPGNALSAGGPTAAPTGGNALAAPALTTNRAAAAPPPAPAAAPAVQLAGDGKPLVPPGYQMVTPSLGAKGVAGINVLSPSQLTNENNLQAAYAGPEKGQFDMAQSAKASMVYMDNAYKTLIKNGGFLVPGSAENLRADLARAANTIYQMLPDTVKSSEPPFDPAKIASVEDFNKETKRMGLMVTKQFLGGQREAAAIIQGITSSVPGVENSYMGGKLVLDGINAATQRVIDGRNWENLWKAKNQGNLTGADEAFNLVHPAEQYATGVLDKMGMTEGGFKNIGAVVNAVREGYLTTSQGKQIARDEFGYKG